MTTSLPDGPSALPDAPLPDAPALPDGPAPTADGAPTSATPVDPAADVRPAAVALGLDVQPPATARVGSALVPRPTVQLLGRTGLPARHARVEVQVALDGGEGGLAGTTTQRTDIYGRATFPDLSFTGLAAGSRRLRFTSAGLGEVASFWIEVAAGPAAQLAAVSATLQRAPEGTAVPEPPAVAVRDAGGNPVAGVAVHFEVVDGGGAVAGVDPVSDAGGVARVGSWTLGTGAEQELRATLPDVPDLAVAFAATATATTSPAAGYDVALRYLAPLSSSQRAAFEDARSRIEAVIVGDVTDIDLAVPAYPGCGDVAVSERVDDLLILVDVRPIDGVGGVLGRAGPCYVRGGALQTLPILALMEFDSADLDAMEATGQLEAVVLHEMFHTVGFGTLWSSTPHLHGYGEADPFFDGPASLDAFLGFDGGATYGGSPVPVEAEGNAGTRDAHWRESVFRDELMTGWLSGAYQPLSRTTLASLADLGYLVDLAAAEPLSSRSALRAMAAGPALHLGDDVLRVPLGTVDEHGVATPVH